MKKFLRVNLELIPMTITTLLFTNITVSFIINWYTIELSKSTSDFLRVNVFCSLMLVGSMFLTITTRFSSNPEYFKFLHLVSQLIFCSIGLFYISYLIMNLDSSYFQNENIYFSRSWILLVSTIATYSLGLSGLNLEIMNKEYKLKKERQYNEWTLKKVKENEIH